jgi:nitroreductase
MTLVEAIKARRSIRKYKPDAINQDHIDALLEAAMLAPSAGGTRPWEFVVVRDRAILNSLMAVHPHASMLKEAPLAIVVCAKPTKENAMLASFFQQDCGAATENILLRAVELGLGTCWLGVYPEQDRVKKVSEIVGAEIPFSIVAVGVPNESPGMRGSYDKTRVKYI